MGSLILALEIAFAALISLAQGYPTTPGSQSMILNCLGRNEVFFEFDYFTIGGFDRKNWKHCDVENLFGKFGCLITLIIGVTVESNFLEIFLTGRILCTMNYQTNNSAHMLTEKDFSSRKR